MPRPEIPVNASRNIPAGPPDIHPNGRAGTGIRLPTGRAAPLGDGTGHNNGEQDRYVAIVGGGYTGLALAAYLVTSGRLVCLVEADPERRRALTRGEVPIYEPGLEAVLPQAAADATLEVTGDLGRALGATRMVFIAVGTPPSAQHHADLDAVMSVVSEIRARARPGTVVVLKSTVPPGTARRIQEQLQGPPFRLPVVSCPEFLREGSALRDMRAPARQVIGGDDSEAMRRLEAVIHAPGVPVVRTDWTSAELIKYGSNSFLALKISFANELARFAELVGADIAAVVRGMGFDLRIGPEGMRPGLGFGGSCLPKDVHALIAAAELHGAGCETLKAALQVNAAQRTLFVQKIRQALGGQLSGRRVAVLGLAFKPGTDDVREAPSLDVIGNLLEQGAELTAHDPCAIRKAAPLLPPQVRLTPDPYDCLYLADAAAIVTEWPEYVRLDWDRARQVMRHAVLVDGRNCLDPTGIARLGFRYHPVGRPPAGPAQRTRQPEVTAPVRGVSA